MKFAPHRKAAASNSKGASVLDLLIVVVIVAIVVTYVLTEIFIFKKPMIRSKAADQLASYLELARNDSQRRHANERSVMAQITILDARSYNVMMDANGDGVLDPPVLIDLTGLGLKLNGPFPRTLMFDSTGRTIDQSKTSIPFAAVLLSDSSGTSMVKLSEFGRPTVTKS